MRTEIPHHPSNQEWINMALGLAFALSSSRPTRRIYAQEGRKENAELIDRCRASVLIHTAMDTKLSPASQTRASTATCLRELIDNTKDRSNKEPRGVPVSPTTRKRNQPYTEPLTDTPGHTPCGNCGLLPQDHSRK